MTPSPGTGESREARPVLIEAVGVRRAWGEGAARTEVLAGVDLTVHEGEFIAVTGASGSGKSTLLSILGGLDSGFSGTVRVAGRELGAMKDGELSRFRASTVGFVFQSFHLLPHLSVLDNVLVPCAWVPPRTGAQREALRLLDAVGLADRASELPTRLSGGQKQRVAIARALVNGAQLLLCDEPTGNLDVATGQSILGLLDAANRERGAAVVVVTHEAHVTRAARRIVELRAGRIASDTGARTE